MFHETRIKNLNVFHRAGQLRTTQKFIESLTTVCWTRFMPHVPVCCWHCHCSALFMLGRGSCQNALWVFCAEMGGHCRCPLVFLLAHLTASPSARALWSKHAPQTRRKMDEVFTASPGQHLTELIRGSLPGLFCLYWVILSCVESLPRTRMLSY